MPKTLFFRNANFLRRYLVRQTQAGRSLHGIQRDEFPGAKVGTLSRIVNDRAYDPMHLELRAALHLAEVCTRCHRPFKKQRARKARASHTMPALAAWWLSIGGNQRSDEILHMEER